MEKRVFYSEIAYVLGILFIALSAAMLRVANFGMSMIVAFPYLLHLKVSETYSFFTFGMAEYTFQGVLIILLAIACRRFKVSYLLSLVTAVIYGFVLDSFVYLLGFVPVSSLIERILFYAVGIIICGLGVSLIFKTYISPEAYELFVKEISGTYKLPIGRVKTCYDMASLILSVVFSFVFFGRLNTSVVYIGTLVSALVSGTLIGLFTKFLDAKFKFVDGLKWRGFFEK